MHHISYHQRALMSIKDLNLLVIYIYNIYSRLYVYENDCVLSVLSWPISNLDLIGKNTNYCCYYYYYYYCNLA